MSLINDRELDAILRTTSPEIAEVRLSCKHTRRVELPVGTDLDAQFATTDCPEGCGRRLIVEKIKETA